MNLEGRIDYVEIPVTDPGKARDFFSALYGWKFEEWGKEYISFNDDRLEGGFRHTEVPAPSTDVLLIFYSENLERDITRVKKLSATISQENFPFPGGRRFHFIDPIGTEFAIWSDR